jgi:hypothetical protein
MLATGVLQVLGGLISGGIGGALVVTGLSRWLGDVWLGHILEKQKAKYGRELEQLKAGFAENLERYRDALDRSKHLLRARIDSSVFVTRAHFETEFGAYKKIFEGLAEVRLLMPAMHPLISVTRSDETREDKLKNLAADLAQLQEAHNKSVRTIENLGPFYPKEILEKINKCLQFVRIEMLRIQTGGASTFSLEWSMMGEKRVEDFLAAYQDASDAVRQRIETLAILPSKEW